MKNLLLLLSFMLVLISCGDKEVKKEIVVPAKKVEEVKKPIVKKEEVKPELVFTVQIGANKKKSNTFSSIKNIQVFKENGMFKYRLGAFITYQEAKSYRKQILQKHPGAFVQAVKNKQAISINEAIK